MSQYRGISAEHHTWPQVKTDIIKGFLTDPVFSHSVSQNWPADVDIEL